ncbi:hypothetical protein SLEP1_g14926 [Rubroshorea leprosula]|uniref:Uncharacterized protein n=1 Tax=Rubroshorea leprosula TaxID=152421 RepID=A0AAV5ITL6_9ROSI|nr:hypothetical protein SLEP1_g14926 [Rubroshorea leprosula]
MEASSSSRSVGSIRSGEFSMIEMKSENFIVFLELLHRA